MLIVSFVLVVLSAENIASLYGGCVTVSILVHYFTLVAVMWMGAEALLMFQKLVIVFVRITTKFIVAVSTVCWSKYNIMMYPLPSPPHTHNYEYKKGYVVIASLYDPQLHPLHQILTNCIQYKKCPNYMTLYIVHVVGGLLTVCKPI